MITTRFLISMVAALASASLAAAAQKKAPEPRAEPMSEATALGILKSDADLHQKAYACQELANYGTVKAVPALAALLSHEELADYARSGLESIRDASAGEALRKALPKLEGRLLAGVVNSLGVRREKAAVSDLRMLAMDNKRGVAADAVAALGLISSADSAKALQDVLAKGPAELKVPATHAALASADLLAKEGNASAAKSLLDAAAKAAPAGKLAQVVQNQKTAIGRK